MRRAEKDRRGEERMEGDRREGVRRGECKGEVRRGMEGRKLN